MKLAMIACTIVSIFLSSIAQSSGRANKLSFKILVIGNSNSGKTAFLRRKADELYEHNLQPTVGIGFRILKTKVNSTNLNLKVWDTCGSERFLSLTTQYLRGADGIFLAYDISNRDSFENLNYWLNLIKDHQSNSNTPYIISIIANKSDLESERQVSYNEGKSFADIHGFSFFETSAKENTNVDKAFREMSYSLFNTVKFENKSTIDSTIEFANDVEEFTSNCCSIQ